MTTEPEIIYFYVKGSGWLAGYEQHLPKQSYVWNTSLDDEYLREQIRRYWGDYQPVRQVPRETRETRNAQMWWEYERWTQRPLEPLHYTYTYDDTVTYNDGNITITNLATEPAPAPRPPETPTRFFPGVEEQPAPIPQENQHERRTNIFRRTVERIRRGR